MERKNFIALCLFLTIATASIGHLSGCGFDIFRLRQEEPALGSNNHEAVAAINFFWLCVAVLIFTSLAKIFISFKYPDGRAFYFFTLYLGLYGAGLTCMVTGANQRGVLREFEQYPEQYSSYHSLIHVDPYYFLILVFLVLTCGRHSQAKSPINRDEIIEPMCLAMLSFFVLRFGADHVGILSLQTMDATRKHALYQEEMQTFDALIIAAYSLSAFTASTAMLDLTLAVNGKKKWSLWARLLNCVCIIGGNLISLVTLFRLMEQGKVDAFGGIAFNMVSILLLLANGVIHLERSCRTEPSHSSGVELSGIENGLNQKPNNNENDK